MNLESLLQDIREKLTPTEDQITEAARGQIDGLISSQEQRVNDIRSNLEGAEQELNNLRSTKDQLTVVPTEEVQG